MNLILVQSMRRTLITYYYFQAAAPIFRAINVRRICRGKGRSAHEQSLPGGGELWRGGGFCNDHIPTFEALLNKKYRVRDLWTDPG